MRGLAEPPGAPKGRCRLLVGLAAHDPARDPRPDFQVGLRTVFVRPMDGQRMTASGGGQRAWAWKRW